MSNTSRATQLIHFASARSAFALKMHFNTRFPPNLECRQRVHVLKYCIAELGEFPLDIYPLPHADSVA